jgi:putative ATPase
MDCLPSSLQGKQYYRPTTRGFEEEVSKRLEEWRKLRDKAKT